MSMPLKGTGCGRMCKAAPLCCLNLTDSHPSLLHSPLWRRAHSPGKTASYDERGERLLGSLSLFLPFGLCQQRMFLLKSEKCWPQRDKSSTHCNVLNQEMSQFVISCSQIDSGLVDVCQTSKCSYVECRNHLAAGNNIYLLLPQTLLASLAQFEINTGSQMPW